MHSTNLLFLFVFEFKGRLDAAPLVQETPSHVDLPHVAEVQPDEVERQIVDQVG